jgi:hypothetical protein
MGKSKSRKVNHPKKVASESSSEEEPVKPQVPPAPKLPPYAFQLLAHTFKIVVKNQILEYIGKTNLEKTMQSVFKQVSEMNEDEREAMFQKAGTTGRRRASTTGEDGKTKRNPDMPVRKRTAYQLWGPSIDAAWIEAHYPDIYAKLESKELKLSEAKSQIWAKCKAEESKNWAPEVEKDKQRFEEEMELFKQGKFKREKRGRTGTPSRPVSRAPSPEREVAAAPPAPVEAKEPKRDKSPVRKKEVAAKPVAEKRKKAEEKATKKKKPAKPKSSSSSSADDSDNAEQTQDKSIWTECED